LIGAGLGEPPADGVAGGQDTRNGREGRHQDGPQAHAPGFEHGGTRFVAGGAALVGEFDEQDRVLRDQADEEDEAD